MEIENYVCGYVWQTLSFCIYVFHVQGDIAKCAHI